MLPWTAYQTDSCKQCWKVGFSNELTTSGCCPRVSSNLFRFNASGVHVRNKTSISRISWTFRIRKVYLDHSLYIISVVSSLQRDRFETLASRCAQKITCNLKEQWRLSLQDGGRLRGMKAGYPGLVSLPTSLKWKEEWIVSWRPL